MDIYYLYMIYTGCVMDIGTTNVQNHLNKLNEYKKYKKYKKIKHTSD